jgi:hypothetical protein
MDALASSGGGDELDDASFLGFRGFISIPSSSSSGRGGENTSYNKESAFCIAWKKTCLLFTLRGY